jgi:hypothetical protein
VGQIGLAGLATSPCTLPDGVCLLLKNEIGALRVTSALHAVWASLPLAYVGHFCRVISDRPTVRKCAPLLGSSPGVRATRSDVRRGRLSWDGAPSSCAGGYDEISGGSSGPPVAGCRIRGASSASDDHGSPD